MRFPLILLVAVSACAQFPELDGTVAPSVANASPPDLIPLTALFAQANTSSQIVQTAQSDIAPRLSGLRARADRLRRPVIDPATRSRMLRGVR